MPAQPSIPGRRHRRRDRRGREVRGPLIPVSAPGHRTRAEHFDDLLLAVVDDLERRFPARLAEVEFAVEDAPISPFPEVDRRIVFGRHVPANQDGPDRIVVYRRPLEVRATEEAELAMLVRTVTVDCVAEFLGVSPHDIDPWLD